MPKSDEKVKRVRVVVADDNKNVRDTVVRMLQQEFEVIGTATNGSAALEMTMFLAPEIVIVDISMPVISGIEAANEIRRKGSKAKLVFLTVHEDPDFVRAALKAGASGYVVKSQMATDLVVAIRAAVEGNFFISPSCALPKYPSRNNAL